MKLTSIEKKMLIAMAVFLVMFFMITGFIAAEIQEHGLKTIVEAIWEGEK